MRVVSFGMFLLAATAATAQTDWVEESNRYATMVLEAQGEFAPEGASALGLSDFDDRIFDLQSGYRDRRATRYGEVIAELRAEFEETTHAKIRQDLAILIGSLEDSLHTSDVYFDHLLPYFNLHQQLFSGFNDLLDPRTEDRRYEAAKERLAKYTGLEPGYEPIVDLAMARTRERFGADGLVGPFLGQLESDLDNGPRLEDGLRSIFERSGLDGWQESLRLLTDQLSRYSEWLRTEMLPRARTDNPLPEAVYTVNLRNFGVEATPQELIAIGQYSYQLIRSEMKSLAVRIAAERGWQDNDLVSVLATLKREQIPPDGVLDLYRERLTAVEEIIRREDLITLPERDAAIRLATEAESAIVPAPFMSAPQLIDNTGQYGEFVLVQTNPGLGTDAVMDDWSHDAITWSLTVHEARPGHELQFASLVENGTSLARAIFAFNSANVEGWGLYAESIMQEFLPLEGQLFNLFGRLIRAARMFLDPLVNTGRLSPADTVTFLVEQTVLSQAMASSEADRYAFRAPGQATSYYHGYTKLMSLRTEVEVALGDEFNQKVFHDLILEQGLLPHDLLREAVLDELVR